jgi:dsDNA-specific endonuclease/ATPase MutS2
MNIFGIGDKVALIHEKSSGIVTDVQGNLITVYLEDMGMDIEIDAKLLMLIEKKITDPIINQQPSEVADIPVKSEENLNKEVENLKQSGIGYQAKNIQTRKNTAKIPIKIDLHWEVLQKTNPSYAEIQQEAIDEIFRIQRLEFENFFLQALTHNLNMITIIHGIGSGKLRDYIHSYIKRHQKNINSYQVMNEGGVTQVIFNVI